VFQNLGVDGIVSGGQTMNPSTEDILREIDRTPAEIVYVLPNNKNIIMAAEQCVPLSGKKVVVLPTETVPQGISAMLVLDPDADEETNTAEMKAAAARVKTTQVTYAARASEFDGFTISEGDYLALAENRLFGTERDLNVLLKKVAEAEAQQSAEFITIYYGAEVEEAQAQEVNKMFAETCPNAEVSLLSGGQPVYYYLIAAE
jgi:dihydroxyacetone kinase-like predicted kinase